MSAFSTVLKIMLSDTVLVTPATLQQLRFMRATQLRSASQEVASAALTRSLSSRSSVSPAACTTTALLPQTSMRGAATVYDAAAFGITRSCSALARAGVFLLWALIMLARLPARSLYALVWLVFIQRADAMYVPHHCCPSNEPDEHADHSLWLAAAAWLAAIAGAIAAITLVALAMISTDGPQYIGTRRTRTGRG